jgi:hypothetical protein
MSYKAEIIRALMVGMIQEKVRRGWTIRPNCLLEDAAGNVFTFDLKQTDDQVLVNLKKVNLA